MSDTQTISNPTWTVTLPAEWASEDDADSGLFYESADGSRAMYIATWTMAAGHALPARDLAEHFLAADVKKVADMADDSWTTLRQELACAGTVCTAMLDTHEPNKQYRMISKIITREGKAVRAVFHDYACGDLAASEQFFAPLVASLQFTPPA